MPWWQTATETPVCMDFGNIQTYSIIENIHFILLLTSTKWLTVHVVGVEGTYLGQKQFLNFYSLDIQTVTLEEGIKRGCQEIHNL